MRPRRSALPAGSLRQAGVLTDILGDSLHHYRDRVKMPSERLLVIPDVIYCYCAGLVIYNAAA
jgi:hypothetical protein